MDLEVNIKEEPAWLEETTNASLENIERVSEVIALKKEAKSELTEPESTQENSLEPSKDNKKEIFIEQHTDDQLLAYIKEETKYVHREACTIWNILYLYTVVFSSGCLTSETDHFYQFNSFFTRLHLNTNILKFYWLKMP
ncbi:uncharacterized protein [Anabrus simplex]|uniref:uncharacterized protein n=1 Tax=Anabrus simplex TaxID=316456 RepID=UPI0035A29410